MVTIIEKNIEIEQSLAPIQDTSLKAIPSKLVIETQNRQVYLFLKALPDSTMKEVSKGLGIPINTITWRFADLRKEGMILESSRDREIH